ncbi:ABC transporter ATP-binding protein [Jatrophihabitans endophyticus]|uniref:ABC transporter ATP-binding protein n=1 Tax=Jatrophihabitans endophyticus TaxID=1206085 RepID=UPI0019E02AA0|nr:ABC transporter ATP-binding protein [Jatrophihabitans endophyticus]MBE7188608.1 ABC transporter ATP-binding protein [Jatrophihabitans endophyticus]
MTAAAIDAAETALDVADRRAGRRLLRALVRPYRRPIAVVLVIAVLQTAATMAGPWLVGVAIDTAIPAALRGDYAPLIGIGVGLGACAVLSGWLRSLFVVRSGVVGQDILYDLRLREFDHVQRLSVAFHEKFTSGKVISRLTSDVETLRELLDSGLDGLLTALFNMIAIAVLLLVLDVPLALIALFALVPLWLLVRWFSPRAAVAFRNTREHVAALIVGIVENLNGIRAVQAFRRETRNDEAFGELNDAYRHANAETFRLQALFIPGTAFVGNLAIVAVLVVGALRVAHGGLELGVLTSFLLYLRQFYDPLEDLGIFYNSLQSATAALNKIAALLAEQPGVPEPANPQPLPDPVRGAVGLDAVDFAYRADVPVLRAVDLEVPAGQTVALVGATGAGKTTIAKLISRFYDPTGGTVTLDGVDLRTVDDLDLRRAIVMVTQDGFLFSGSVADNIGFGRRGATREQIEDAARAVGAHEFIAALPDGYDTDVRKRGGRLSAGQRQLVAFARAFLADPAVLILDEATSSLDVPSERAVQRALRTVLASRTALIIAHRLSTVEIADRVLVLEAGGIVEDGPPDALIAAGGGRFAQLHSSWRDSLV